MRDRQTSPPAGWAGPTDEQLACSVQAGSSACFDTLVRRHEGRLLRFLLHRTRSLHDAEDLLQDAFALAYRRIDTYSPRWKFTTWLYTIAARLAARHGTRRRAAALRDPDALRSRDEDPADVVADDESRRNLWTLAGEVLSANQHAALWLRYAEAMPVREIARVLGKTRTHVKVLLFRARSALARQVDPSLVPGPHGRAPAAAPPPYVSSASEGGGRCSAP